MLKRLAVLLCAAALSVACGQSDAGITTAVKAKLAADTMVRAYEIDVDSQNRVVTLSGEVETSAARDQALQVARSTDGVREVVDQLRVSETAATTGALDDMDPDIGADADADIDADPDIDTDIDSDVDDQARSAAREGRQRAGEAADRAGDAVTDAGVTSAVKAKLLADTRVGGLDIDVDTRNGVVTLSGSVESRAEADQAIKLARATEGVKHVVDKMTIGGDR